MCFYRDSFPVLYKVGKCLLQISLIYKRDLGPRSLTVSSRKVLRPVQSKRWEQNDLITSYKTTVIQDGTKEPVLLYIGPLYSNN